uniref:Uncharacterized protein n=1 Tax=Rhizophora mucronata TaxID=61149 RepID=A0A2P2Q2X0_RHIMU
MLEHRLLPNGNSTKCSLK